MDYRCNSSYPVAAWLFRPEYKSKVSTNGGLDSHSDRNRDHPRYIEAAWGDLTFWGRIGKTGSGEA